MTSPSSSKITSACAGENLVSAFVAAPPSIVTVGGEVKLVFILPFFREILETPQNASPSHTSQSSLRNSAISRAYPIRPSSSVSALVNAPEPDDLNG